jgi:hypothetical protein
MYGQYRNSGIYSLSTYEEACARYDNVKPIAGKGRNAGLRPLGHRNKMQFQIRKTGDVIECICYDTPVVTFHPDGIIAIKDGGYVSQTTANFIKDVLHIGVAISDKDIQIRIRNDSYRLKSGMKLKRDGLVYKVVEAATHEVYHIDRKKMNALRKQVQEFRTYLAGVVKVRDGYFEREEFHEAFPNYGSNWSLELQPWRQDIDQVVPLMRHFIDTVSQEDSDGNWYKASLQLVWSGFSHRTKLRTTVFQELSHIDDLLIATHPEVLLVSQCEPGVFKKNAYAMFKKYKELQA